MTDTTGQPSDGAATSQNDSAPRESFARRIKPFVLIVLVIFLPVTLLHVFIQYMYVGSIPAGTKVVDPSLIARRSGLGEYFYTSGLALQYPRLKPYLDYRHYVIPEGAETIADGTFCHSDICDDLRGVSIPGSVKMIGRGAFERCGNLRDIIIPDGVEKLDHHAFEGCSGLKTIVIPGTVKSISLGAFRNCTGLREVVIRDGVKEIGAEAFANCTSLRTIVIPYSVEMIGSGAFESCISLEEVRLPAGMTRPLTEEEIARKASAILSRIGSGHGPVIPMPIIGSLVFGGCTSLKKVTLPDGIETIAPYAFLDCTSLSEINLPDSVTEIGEEAFYGCRSLPPLTLGNNLRVVSGGAFTGTRCPLIVPDDHPTLRFQDGMLYGKDTGSLISCVSPPDGPCVIAPDVKIIRKRAFFRCDGPTEIRLPNGLETIEREAFLGCTGLTRLELPDSLRRIESSAFAGCPGLTGSLVIPPKVAFLGSKAFANCTGLTDLTLASGAGDLEYGVFTACTDLKRVTLPEGLETIPEEMFARCTQLEQIVIPDGVTEIGPGAFVNCTGLKHVTIPDSLEWVDTRAFSGCNSLDRETRDKLSTIMTRMGTVTHHPSL